MNRLVRVAVALGICCASLSADARASGGSPMPPSGGASSMPSAPRKTPEEQAVEFYNAGLKYRDKALAFEKEGSQAASEKDKSKLEKKAQQEFGKAISQFRLAIEKYPKYYQAHSDLGYALRKTGDYPAALETYDRAISLSPNYAPAIEYRAEAYLALDRVEDAKKAYMDLFPSDRGRADELLKAMKGWVEKRRAEPGSLTPDAVQEFSHWVEQRDELAGQTPSLSELQQRKW
ncbi:MAG TPA: tetratricopeptide repeat protein [Candidatus Polarisedimenticolia bacterium]|nr:tetratricopeptide repeat protein [Candidatus Polarisedimenticolia bacterium]